MTKAIIQGLFILTLIIGVSIAEALMPLAIPETQAVNRFYTPDGMEGTLTGWQECRAAGLKMEKGRSDRQIMGHCTNGYAVAQSAPVRFSDVRTHDEASACAFSLDFDNKPYRRFLSATISNRDKGIYVARVSLKTANPLNLTDKVSNIIDVWLEPGAKQHRCFGIVFRFETEAEAHRFDTAIASAKIELLGVYGVSDKPAELPEQPSKPSFGKLPDATNA